MSQKVIRKDYYMRKTLCKYPQSYTTLQTYGVPNFNEPPKINNQSQCGGGGLNYTSNLHPTPHKKKPTTLGLPLNPQPTCEDEA